jgi:hypothetical protein
MIGLEALGMSLEDIFITVVDKTEDEKNSSRHSKGNAQRRVRRSRTALESQLADNLVKDAEQKREEASDTPIDED